MRLNNLESMSNAYPLNVQDVIEESSQVVVSITEKWFLEKRKMFMSLFQ